MRRSLKKRLNLEKSDSLFNVTRKNSQKNFLIREKITSNLNTKNHDLNNPEFLSRLLSRYLSDIFDILIIKILQEKQQVSIKTPDNLHRNFFVSLNSNNFLHNSKNLLTIFLCESKRKFIQKKQKKTFTL